MAGEWQVRQVKKKKKKKKGVRVKGAGRKKVSDQERNQQC